MFPAVIAFSIAFPSRSGRIFWTVIIASLPLFFVLAGYHRWRRICPLALISQAPAFFGLDGKRRAGAWLQSHGYTVPFGVLLLSLWLRLVATNGDGYAIAAFLVAISLAAFVTGLVFTGKTWCNYVCPVSFVEKLYTEPRGIRDTPNSQCQRCTACRPTCPDINQENSYWKEILLADKRRVFFAFPGVVLAFYVYYFLQAGTWEYYFDGRWTGEVGLIRTAFLPGSGAATAGLFVWPTIPRAVGAAATLLCGASLSLLVFSFAERRIASVAAPVDAAADQQSLRHVMFSLAAFTAFVTFYSFAGAPTLRLVSGLPHVFQLLVVTTGTIFLLRRIGRRQRNFSEETLARRIIASWPWGGTPPRELREAFVIHAVRSQAQPALRVNVIEAYKNAVRESLHSGILTRADVYRLESLRNGFRIADADHERVMSELAEEDRGLVLNGVAYASPEKQLQLKTYADALAECLDRRPASLAGSDDAEIQRLREKHRVSIDEHNAVLDYLLRSREGIEPQALEAPIAIEEAAAVIRSIEAAPSSVSRFLSKLLIRRWTRHVEALVRTLPPTEEHSRAVRDRLLSADTTIRRAAIRELAARLSPALADRLIEPFDRASRLLDARVDRTAHLRSQLSSPDPYIRATALYMLESAEQATETDRQLLHDDEHPLVRETLEQARVVADGGTVAEASILERVIALGSISIFETLEPEDLLRLARASTEAWFRQGDVLCREGEVGDEVFVLLAGEVEVLREAGSAHRVYAVERAGGCIGELSVLDSAPREATVVASTIAVRTLRLNGRAFRDVQTASPAAADAIIRLLARRLRAVVPKAPAPAFVPSKE